MSRNQIKQSSKKQYKFSDCLWIRLSLIFIIRLNKQTNKQASRKINLINFIYLLFKGYNIKKSQVYMCNDFKEKGPDQGVRGARHFSESEVINKFK